MCNAHIHYLCLDWLRILGRKMLIAIRSNLPVLLVVLALAGCGGGSDTYHPQIDKGAGLAQSAWPKYRGDTWNTGQGKGSGARNSLRWGTAAGSADRVEASPVIGLDGTIVIGADDGKVYAIDGVTGVIRWAITVQSQGVDSTAAIGVDGTVYVGAGNSVVALYPSTGAEKWRFATTGDVESSPTVGPDGTLYVGADDAKVYALNATTGALKWFFVFPDGSDTDSSPALGADGTVYIGSGEGTLYALDGQTGQLKWSFIAVGEISGAPALGADATVYFSAVNSAEAATLTYAIDGASGLQKWVKSLPSDSATSVALGTDGTVFVAGVKLPDVLGDTAGLRAVVWALDGETGQQKWERLLEEGSQGVSAPSLGADGTVYVHAEKPTAAGGIGKLTAIDPLTGRVNWEFATGGSSNSSPAIGPDGTVYVGSDDGKVYAIR
jgi:outer membrane protein assembly factor BamB